AVSSGAAAACRLEQSVSCCSQREEKSRAEQSSTAPLGQCPVEVLLWGLVCVWSREEMGLDWGPDCGNERASARSSSPGSNPM
ncbi:unnamed protein product, partial [Urochloa humidicola]